MPTYDYRCAKCGQHLEVYQSFSEEPLTKHKGCGGKLAKVLSPAGIVLKGSGFYKTDNGNGRSRTSKDSSKESSGESSARSESKSESKSDTKSDTKSDSKPDSKPAKSA